MGRVRDRHGHGTRSARDGIFVSTRDHRSVGYRVPKEWGLLPVGLRRVGSLATFKRRSRAGFLGGYAGFRCGVRSCYVCTREADGSTDMSQRGEE